MSGALQAVFQNQRSFGPPTSQQAYTTAGTYSWVAPAGVTKVSIVVVGANDGFRGSALSYKNNISVTPGCSYAAFVSSASANRSYFIATCIVSAGNQCARTGDGGGNGGSPGGAGGYSGDGGGGTLNGAGLAGAGGGGGGGGDFYCANYYGCGDPLRYHGGGGGVGLLGQGSNGAGGAYNGFPGTGGSGGASGTASNSATSGNGGIYGGSAGFRSAPTFYPDTYGTSGSSALRIIWPGCARSFPSTRTADE